MRFKWIMAVGLALYLGFNALKANCEESVDEIQQQISNKEVTRSILTTIGREKKPSALEVELEKEYNIKLWCENDGRTVYFVKTWADYFAKTLGKEYVSSLGDIVVTKIDPKVMKYLTESGYYSRSRRNIVLYKYDDMPDVGIIFHEFFHHWHLSLINRDLFEKDLFKIVDKKMFGKLASDLKWLDFKKPRGVFVTAYSNKNVKECVAEIGEEILKAYVLGKGVFCEEENLKKMDLDKVVRVIECMEKHKLGITEDVVRFSRVYFKDPLFRAYQQWIWDNIQSEARVYYNSKMLVSEKALEKRFPHVEEFKSFLKKSNLKYRMRSAYGILALIYNEEKAREFMFKDMPDSDDYVFSQNGIRMSFDDYKERVKQFFRVNKAEIVKYFCSKISHDLFSSKEDLISKLKELNKWKDLRFYVPYFDELLEKVEKSNVKKKKFASRFSNKVDQIEKDIKKLEPYEVLYNLKQGKKYYFELQLDFSRLNSVVMYFKDEKKELQDISNSVYSYFEKDIEKFEDKQKEILRSNVTIMELRDYKNMYKLVQGLGLTDFKKIDPRYQKIWRQIPTQAEFFTDHKFQDAWVVVPEKVILGYVRSYFKKKGFGR